MIALSVRSHPDSCHGRNRTVTDLIWANLMVCLRFIALVMYRFIMKNLSLIKTMKEHIPDKSLSMQNETNAENCVTKRTIKQV